MVLNIIGLGLGNFKDISVNGLECIKRCSKLYYENYTSLLGSSISELEEFYGKSLILADRDMVENKADQILEEAKDSEIGLLIVGDPMGATTHIDIVLRARKAGVKVKIIHNTSILTAVGEVGLELYKYGKTTSIVFPAENWTVETHYDVIKANKGLGLHTLCLLDIQSERYMTVNEALKNLLDIEGKRGEGVVTSETIVIGCARLGNENLTIKSGKVSELFDFDFGGPLHCLIIPGKLHFMEEEALEVWK